MSALNFAKMKAICPLCGQAIRSEERLKSKRQLMDSEGHRIMETGKIRGEKARGNFTETGHLSRCLGTGKHSKKGPKKLTTNADGKLIEES